MNEMPKWMNDPELAGIDKAKLDFIQMMEIGRASCRERV